MIEHVSAVTFCVRQMERSVRFYEKLGFAVIFGGAGAEFTSLQGGEAFVNLILKPDYAQTFWGRAIFRVRSADDQYNKVIEAGLQADAPADAEWGERFFHLRDPDGHELSFAELLNKSSPKK